MKSFKLFLFAALLVLSLTGLANAANTGGVVDAAAGPELWVTNVYNNSGADLDVGDVVIWDFANSTGDNDNYITTTSTGDYTGAIAGVVYPSPIGTGERGSIVIRGVVPVDVINNAALAEGNYLCTSTTLGSAKNCLSVSNGTAFGFVTGAAVSNSASVYVTGNR